MAYQAKLPVPFGLLGIQCQADGLTRIDFLAPDTQPQQACSALAQIICEQLLHYIANPEAKFSVPLKLNGTRHQLLVWQALCAIPRGQTQSYGYLAKALKSSAQAVGQACGANPIPLIIPCHRVIGKNGSGGFMRQRSGDSLAIKHWLLKHEGVVLPALSCGN